MNNDTDTTTESRKRAKLAPTSPETDEADDTMTNITDLTNDNLVSIAEYLEKTSRVLFAVALTAPSTSWKHKKNAAAPNALSQSIISLEKQSSPLPLLAFDYGPYNEEYPYQWPLLESQLKLYYSFRWEVLDFSDLDTLLSKRLTDDDVCAVLACINARDTLKTLKLQGCVNIRGCGLEPLRGSTVLEQVDLSSKSSQFQEPSDLELLTSTTSQLSEEVVTPILLSITSLQQVHLPGKIPHGSNTTNTFYSQFQGLGEAYCYVCRESSDTVDKCSCCTKTYCQGCVPVHSCGSCDKKFCLGCQYTIQNEIGFDCGNPDCHVWMGSELRHQNEEGGNNGEVGEGGDEEAINELLCFSCLDVKCCDHCSRDYCSSCSDFTTCGPCGGTKCEHCWLGCSDD